MAETIAFPDVEAVLVGWLPAALEPHDLPTLPDGSPQSVSTRVPNPRPPRFIRVIRSGGPRQNLVTDGAQITVECWDDNAPGAAATARIVRAVLLSARNVRTPSGYLIYGADEFSGPALLPDVSQQPRYTWTLRVRLRGVPIGDAPTDTVYYGGSY